MPDATTYDPFNAPSSSTAAAPGDASAAFNLNAARPNYPFDADYSQQYPFSTQQQHPYQPYQPYQSYQSSFQPYPYSAPYTSSFPATSLFRQPPLTSNAREASAVLVSGMQDALSRFARVSSMVEDVLRSLHMLFDAVFALAYAVGAVRQEATGWLALSKRTSLRGRIKALLWRLWNVLNAIFVSPFAAERSPILYLLRLLKIIPPSMHDAWEQRTQF